MTNNIPYSLALRMVRICTLPEDRDRRLAELRDMLLDRHYKPGIIDSAIKKAKKLERKEVLKKVEHKKTTFSYRNCKKTLAHNDKRPIPS